MPYRKDHKPSSSNSKHQLEASEDLEDTPVYIKPPRYGAISHKINQPTHYMEPHLIKPNELTPGISRSEYESRRRRLFSKIPLDSCLILPCNPESKFSVDGKYSYRQNSDFHYFTGVQEAYCLAALSKDAAGNCTYSLFVQKIIEREKCWHGHRCGLRAAIKYFGAHNSYEYMGKDGAIWSIMEGHDRVYFDEMVNEEMTEQIRAYVSKKKNKIRLLKPRKMMQQIRVMKSDGEMVLVRKSAEISALSMIDCMQYCRSGMVENELSVLFEYGCKKRGAQRLSYECSVASGRNAVHLSYFNNNSVMQDGDLVLIDCGCEFNGYSSDITRTFPVNGRFSDAQRELYSMVLSVSDQLIGAMTIGCTIKKLEALTAKWIKKGLKALGVTKKLSTHQIKELKLSCADVHFVAHFIGLDIHDTSDIAHGRSFEENMVLAIEPAVYIPEHPLIPPKYRNIGIRIEDDVWITRDGPQILSNALPRNCDQIEEYMQERSMHARAVPWNLMTEERKEKEEEEEMQRRLHEDEWTECDLDAARTLSSIRFEATQKEKVEREWHAKQYDAIRLLQQALFEEQHNKTDEKKKKIKRKSTTTKACKSQQPQSRKSGGTRSVKTKIKITKKEKKESNGRIPKLWTAAAAAAAAAATHPATANIIHPKSTKRVIRPSSHSSSSSNKSGHNNEKTIKEKKEMMRDNIVICKFDAHHNDTDSTNSIISHCTSSGGAQSSEIIAATIPKKQQKKKKKQKKSIYSSPTAHSHSHSSPRNKKRKREKDKRHRYDDRDLSEPPAKKSKFEEKECARYSHSSKSHSRYKYQYMDHYPSPYYPSPYKNEDAIPSYIPYMSFYPYSSTTCNTNSGGSAISAYEQFMAKSNHKSDN
eukprot:479179_1